MKSRMEKYYEEDKIAHRTTKNDTLYDELYSEKREPANNVMVLDNVNEIDINKIKSMISNREEYKSIKKYQNLVGQDGNAVKNDICFEEPESKNYDINEILEKKRNNREPFERERVRKLSNTQYDILKGLRINKEEESSEEMDTDFFTQERQLKTLINTITKDKEELKTIHETALDLFDNLKGDGNTELVSPINKEEQIFRTREQRNNKDNAFYTSMNSFNNKDFEVLEEINTKVKKTSAIMKILIVLIILVVLCVGFIIISNYIDFKTLLK